MKKRCRRRPPTSPGRREVGALGQRVGVGAVGGEQRDPGAGADRHLDSLQRIGLRQILDHRRHGRLDRLARRDRVDDDGEIVMVVVGHAHEILRPGALVEADEVLGVPTLGLEQVADILEPELRRMAVFGDVKLVDRMRLNIHVLRIPVALLRHALRPPMRPHAELGIPEPVGRGLVILERFKVGLKRAVHHAPARRRSNGRRRRGQRAGGDRRHRDRRGGGRGAETGRHQAGGGHGARGKREEF